MLNSAIPLQVRRKPVNHAAELRAAMGIKQAQSQMKAADAKAARNEALRLKLADAGGDRAKMAEAHMTHGDPKTGLAFEKAGREADEHQWKQAAQEVENVRRLVFSITPQNWQQMRAENPDAGMPEAFDPAWLENERQGAMTASEQIKQASEEARARQAQANADRTYNLSAARLSESRRHNKATEAQKSGLAVNVGPDGSISIASGNRDMPVNVKPTKSVESGVQKDAISDMDAIQRIDKIMDQYDPAFLTLKGRGQNYVAGIADKAGLSSAAQKSLIRRRRKFSESVGREFNAYKKQITGAAASVQEIEGIKQTIMNMDQGPTEFEASVSNYLDTRKRGLRLKRRILREGIRVDDDKAFGRRHDQLWLGGEDDSAMTRGQELQAEGKSDSEIKQILVNEGYIQ